MNHIRYWSTKVPWINDEQVEQDLVISRALIEIYQSEFLRQTMIFRGGTALNKLFFDPPQRYSEDLDFVDSVGGSIDKQITHINEALNNWLGDPVYEEDKNRGLVRLIYTFLSTSKEIPLSLNIEINTTENFCLYDPVLYDYSVSSEWIQKKALVTVYCLEELLATKLRALYMRRKSRDLFDLDTALIMFPELNITKLVDAFHQYKKSDEGFKISSEDFVRTLDRKMLRKAFKKDILPFLAQAKSESYDVQEACERVKLRILGNL